jgi:transitional endoplasmic reticulum ATPase
LLLGPSGTGKTAIVEALAHASGINCVRLKIGGKIASKWQGEGERNLARALQCIDTLQPVIVVIDEIDQAMNRGGGGDNAQERRIFQMLLEYMSNCGNRGRVLFIGLTNRPDLMDAALKRPGRFDKKVPCLVPDEAERGAIFDVMFRKYEVETAGLDLGLAAARTGGYTGAEIEAVVVKAYEVAQDDGREVLERALDAIRPSTADIELMTLLALREVSDLDLLPPRYRERLDDRAGLETEVEEKLSRAPRRGQREL